MQLRNSTYEDIFACSNLSLQIPALVGNVWSLARHNIL